MISPRFLAAIFLTLTIQFFATFPLKAAALQEGYCADWQSMRNALKGDGYQGLFSSISFLVTPKDSKKAQELTDDIPGYKMTRLAALDMLLYMSMHINSLAEKTKSFTTEEQKEEYTYHVRRLLELESQSSSLYPLYNLFYYSNDHRLARVIRFVKFDEKSHILAVDHGCVGEIFSNVEFYDFRKGPETKGLDFSQYENRIRGNISEGCAWAAEVEFHVKCGTYDDVLRDELTHGQRLFIKTSSLGNKLKRIITINQDKMDTGKLLTVFDNGMTIESPELHIVLFTDDMKGMLDKLP